MAYESTHGDAQDHEEKSGLPGFVGGLALTLLVLAILFAIFVLIGAATHPAYFQ